MYMYIMAPNIKFKFHLTSTHLEAMTHISTDQTRNIGGIVSLFNIHSNNWARIKGLLCVIQILDYSFESEYIFKSNYLSIKH